MTAISFDRYEGQSGFKSAPAAFAVRQNQGAVVCDACGCRLDARQTEAGIVWRHYPGIGHNRDARGCRVSCADVAHVPASPFGL